MKTGDDRKLDAINARAVHDPAMREILMSLGLTDGDPVQLRAAMDRLEPSERDELLRRSAELEESSGRSNRAYAQLGDFAQKRWVELMYGPDQVAKDALRKMDPAMQAIKVGNGDAYESYQTKFAKDAALLRETVSTARNMLRSEIRKAIPALGLDLDTETRAPLVDHLTRAAPVPASITEVMGAADKLAAAKSQHDLSLEQQRHRGLAAAPRASLDL